jgi:hypothetical protein
MKEGGKREKDKRLRKGENGKNRREREENGERRD